jgi:hypothetical protein
VIDEPGPLHHQGQYNPHQLAALDYSDELRKVTELAEKKADGEEKDNR